MLRGLIDAITQARGHPCDGHGPPRAGEVLAGRYEIDRVLGAGGKGVVYAARDLELDEIVALKVLRRAPRGSEDAAALDRFRHELHRPAHSYRTSPHPRHRRGGGSSLHHDGNVDGWSLAQLSSGVARAARGHRGDRQAAVPRLTCARQGVIHRVLKPQMS